ncbi:MAG: class II fumarate hydratase [Bacteroidales bacterium]|jgi:fumarate hydratase class II|nr:class II fumarate hydratase [Bacteroidales bacterium]
MLDKDISRDFRFEKDTLGEVRVPADKLWGAQTQRSLDNFKIGHCRIPLEMIRALAIVKKAAAFANHEKNKISLQKRDLIAQVCDEIATGTLDEQFPLVVWQTGSGTQTNMNINEVIANRAEVLLHGQVTGTNKFLSPNDDVNCSQSTNDVFPTAMRVATAKGIIEKLLPALHEFMSSIQEKEKEFQGIVKIGRTHLMDATPLLLSQEFSAFCSQIAHGTSMLQRSLTSLMELPIGGTAVGTGLNAPRGYDALTVGFINDFTGHQFTVADNKFEAMASHDAFVEVSSALKRLAVSCMKIANDFRLLSSGPRCGLGEISLPANEPGSSIMPGKVNPTQCEALSMVCCQVIGNDAAIVAGAMHGHLQLNVFMPLIAHNILTSCCLLTDALRSFDTKCLRGITINKEKIDHYLHHSLMLVTALNPHIGYANAAKIAQHAHARNITLKEAALELKLTTAEEFDQWITEGMKITL